MKQIIFKLILFLGCVALLIASNIKKPSAVVKYEPYIEPKISSESIFALKSYDYIKNHNEELLSIKSEPEKTLFKFLTLAERIDFKCAEITDKNKNDNLCGFNNSINNKETGIYDITDETIFGKNKTVKFCHRDNATFNFKSTTILSGICNLNDNTQKLFSNYDFDWYIIPRIRIDTIFANDIHNLNIPVCCVIATNSAGDTILKTDIKLLNFKDNLNEKYKGEYLEKYFFRPGDDNLMIVPDMMTNKMSGEKIWKENLDIKNISIVWYGFCDMWIDYIRVENEPARELLTKNDACMLDKLKKVIYSPTEEVKKIIENSNNKNKNSY